MSLIAMPGQDAVRKDFFYAIHYLMKGSRLADKIISALGELDQEITILVKEKYLEQRYEGSRLVAPSLIHWWVYDWTEVEKDKFMCPAMALMHELGHSYQWYLGGLYTKFKTRFIHDVQWVEEDNLKNCEQPICKELGQPQRAKYDKSLPMKSEADFRKWGKGPTRILT